LTHADALARYTPLLRAALAHRGVSLEGGPERVSLALVCFQRQTYTYAAIAPELEQAAFVKVNLNPADWRDPADRASFLDACAPEVFTGDPLAFAELAKLPLAARPKALVSTAMTLTAGLRIALEARFRCPVIDIYSLNESGPAAVAEAESNGWQLLQPHLFVEVLNEDDERCAPGVRGEVTLTGGFNPFLPLLRYRTGDFARLEWRGETPLLVDLEGRPPVLFRTLDDRPLNNIDISMALRPLAIAQYTLHQNADGSLRLRLDAAAPLDDARAALLELFGAAQRLTIEPLTGPRHKFVQYTSDVPIAL
jgi:phenylacetate-CoA ligase